MKQSVSKYSDHGNSWLELKPSKTKYGNIEPFENYFRRIQSKKQFSHIPECVLKQWLYAHNDKSEMQRNYGWINYENVEFEQCYWTNEQLTEVHVLEEYMDWYKSKASHTRLDLFGNHRDSWEVKGTWNTPPIILDVNSIMVQLPPSSNIVPPFQLVEGHTRLGHLRSMLKISNLRRGKVADKHKIYLMKPKIDLDEVRNNNPIVTV